MTTPNLDTILPELLALILAPFLVADDSIITDRLFGCFATTPSRRVDFMTRPKPKEPFKSMQPSVLMICGVIHEAGAAILYKMNRFHFLGPQGLYTFADFIGKTKAQRVSQISIHAVNPEFHEFVLGGIVTKCFPNLNRITLERRLAASGIIARSILSRIPKREELEQALREKVRTQWMIVIYPPE
ncbi:hypothetical protein MMC26_002780 [Xylographa opegraphella]|nr:hypothetical protein [Xylographa opegraphella]